MAAYAIVIGLIEIPEKTIVMYMSVIAARTTMVAEMNYKQI